MAHTWPGAVTSLSLARLLRTKAAGEPLPEFQSRCRAAAKQTAELFAFQKTDTDYSQLLRPAYQGQWEVSVILQTVRDKFPIRLISKEHSWHERICKGPGFSLRQILFETDFSRVQPGQALLYLVRASWDPRSESSLGGSPGYSSPSSIPATQSPDWIQPEFQDQGNLSYQTLLP